MKTFSQTAALPNETTESPNFAIDTTFVLFFLAVEFGQMIGSFSFDSFIFGATLVMFIVLPFYLPSEDKGSLGRWLLGRVFIAGFAIVLGMLFKQILGTVLPEMFRFLPMTLLIVTALLSCYIQFYGLLKLRLAK